MITLGFHLIIALPDFTPRIEGEAAEHIAFARLIVIEQVDTSVAHSRCRVPLAEIQPPENRRTSLRPGFKQCPGQRSPILASGPAKAGPVRGVRNRHAWVFVELSN